MTSENGTNNGKGQYIKYFYGPPYLKKPLVMTDGPLNLEDLEDDVIAL